MSDATLLNERSREILKAVVHHFVLTGEPVGSRTLAKRYKMNISPATIRNIMSDLEELEFLSHPHPSAGRIPTDLGYRFFVDNLMDTIQLDKREKKKLVNKFIPFKDQTNELLHHATNVLSDYAKGMGVAIFPNISSYTFKNIQFIRLRSKQILAVFISNSGFIMDKVFDIQEDLSQDDLDRISRFANTEFHNLTLMEIGQKFVQIMGEQQRLYDEIVKKSLSVCTKVFSEMEIKNNQLILNIGKLIDNPDFSDVEELREILRVFEDKKRVLDILSPWVLNTKRPVNISIGTELFPPDFDRLSIITSNYRYEDKILGSLGIIGPKRMNYGKIVSIVKYMADLISKLVTGKRIETCD